MKLKKNYLFIYLVVVWLMSPHMSYAIGTRTTTLLFTNIQTLTGPADQIPFAKIILNSGSTAVNFCNQTDQNYDLGAIYMTPVVNYLNQTYSAGAAFSTNYLYSTSATSPNDKGDPGFAFVPLYAGTNWTGGDFTASSNFTSIPPQRTLAWKGSLSNSNRRGIVGAADGGGVRNSAGVYLWKGSGRPTQDLVVPDQVLYRYECVDTAGTVRQYEDIMVRGFTLPVKVSACAPVSSSVVVTLDPIPVETIKNATNTTLFNTKPQTFSLKCDAGITLKMRVFDINHPGNLTTTAKLSSDSTATGVGFAITGNSGTRLQLSNDSSTAPPDGTTDATQYVIAGMTTSDNQVVNHTLNFSYVRDPDAGDVKSGTAKTTIGITYSYQ